MPHKLWLSQNSLNLRFCFLQFGMVEDMRQSLIREADLMAETIQKYFHCVAFSDATGNSFSRNSSLASNSIKVMAGKISERGISAIAQRTGVAWQLSAESR